MSIFEKYSNIINAAELAESQAEIQANANGSGQREEVPVGKYEVKVEKLECVKARTSGNPMISIWFRIVNGNMKNSMIFYNGVFHQDWMRHRVAQLLSDLIDEGDRAGEINLILKTNDVAQINDFCMDVHELIDGRLEYLLNYGQSKGYPTYTIEEVYI